MWLMTGFGILMPAIRPPKTIAAGDLRTMQIRARRAQDLDILRAEYMRGQLGPTLHTPSFDYEYRAYCTPESFALAAARMMLDIDYLKFKPTTETRYGDRELHDAYNAIWSVVMARLSTRSHQREYWHGQSPAKGKSAPKATTGKHAKPGTAVIPSGTGYPSATAPVYADGTYSFPRPVENIADLSGWAAGRNDYARDTHEPEVWEGEVMDQVAAESLNGYVDGLYDRIFELENRLADAQPMDHGACEHARSDNARSRCRRRRRRSDAVELANLRVELDDYYDKIEKEFETNTDVAESSESVTVATGGSTTN